MIRRETLAALRFGFGLGPGHPPVPDPARLLAGLTGPDSAAAAYPVTPMEEHLALARSHVVLARARRAGEDGAVEELRAFNRARNRGAQRDLMHCLFRAAFSPDDLRERLVLFWANHFSVAGRNARFRPMAPAFLEDAIRPHLAGSFAELLRAAVLHPLMLQYLEQDRSAGPGSEAVQRQGRGGLNENLARELLELHSLGVAGSYTQGDVEGLALLLTGLSFDLDQGFRFRPRRAEPGRFRILGREYGGDRPSLADVEEALDDIARHPDTARHIGRKLAVHFTADAPDPGLVEHLAAAFAAGRGALLPVYEALLEHPAAWVPERARTKPPFDFIASALRALGSRPDQLLALPHGRQVLHFATPLRQMGQPFLQPPSPAGWPEEAAHWITPPALAARISWAMTAPERIAPPQDPRDLVEVALADAAGDDLRFAAAAAESRLEGVGIVLASPAFNRR